MPDFFFTSRTARLHGHRWVHGVAILASPAGNVLWHCIHMAGQIAVLVFVLCVFSTC